MIRYWGAPIGVMLCLPFGILPAMAGAVAGAALSSWRWTLWHRRLRDDPVMQKAFFRLLGYACKLSGTIDPRHIAATQSFMQRCDLSVAHQEAAIRAFNVGKSGIDARSVCARLKRRVESRNTMAWLGVQLVLISRSAYQSTNAEKRIGELLSDFGLPAGLIRLKKNPAPEIRPPARKVSEPTPWELIGVKPGTRGAELKKAYRRSMGQVHPDKIAASGGSEAQIQAAKIKSQKIQDAWARIKHHAR